MEDKNSKSVAGSHEVSNQKPKNSSIAQRATIELQAFFANLIPKPVETNAKQEMDTDELFSQILASSISQGIDDYHEGFETHHPENSSSKALQASSLIGRSVLVEDGYFYIEAGESASGRLNITDSVHHVFVYIENEDEEIVRIIPLGDNLSGEVSFKWNGITRTGEVAPEGEYRFIVSCLCKGRVLELKALTYNKIIRVTFDGGSDDVRLYFENDLTMKLSEIVELLNE